jgi:hypothetical protein
MANLRWLFVHVAPSSEDHARVVIWFLFLDVNQETKDNLYMRWVNRVNGAPRI